MPRREKCRFDTAVGRAVTRLLAEAGVTQRDLALRLGLAPSTLNQMVTGRLPPPGDLVERTRRVLGR